MEAHLRKTVEDLLEKLRGLEKQVADTRRLVNSLCELGGVAPMFAVVDEAPTLTAIKADTFYGQPFATAAATFLRMRKAQNLGPATVNDIYDALKQGGYQFEAKNEDYAKRGIRHSLGKNTATFHKVPNGEFGLLDWYPDVKKKKASTNPSANEDDEDDDVPNMFGAPADADPETTEDDDTPLPDPQGDEWGHDPPPEPGTPGKTAVPPEPGTRAKTSPKAVVEKTANGKGARNKAAAKADV